MCLFVQGHNVRVNAKIAKQDLIVFKKVSLIHLTRSFSRVRFRSYHQRFEYQIGYEYSNDDFPMRTFRNTPLNHEGLHSFKLKNLSKFSSSVRFDNFDGLTCLIECIIPKGTPYYIGKHNDIISQSLIVVKKIDKVRFAILSNTRQKY